MTELNQELLVLKKPLAKPVQSASCELKKAFRASNRYSCAQEMFARWPNLRESSQRLTSILTVYWPDHRRAGESLLLNCLNAGLDEAERTIRSTRDDVSEQKVFINRVAEELAQCLALKLMIKNSGYWTLYDPSIQGYLDEIMRSKKSEALAWVREPHAAFASQHSKLLCASRVFTLAELKLAGLLE